MALPFRNGREAAASAPSPSVSAPHFYSGRPAQLPSSHTHRVILTRIRGARTSAPCRRALSAMTRRVASRVTVTRELLSLSLPSPRHACRVVCPQSNHIRHPSHFPFRTTDNGSPNVPLREWDTLCSERGPPIQQMHVAARIWATKGCMACYRRPHNCYKRTYS